jgi:hypothetical protein
VDVIGYPAIVLDNRSRVDDAVFSDNRAGIDDDSGHYYGPSSDACRRSNDSSRVNKSRGQEPVF